MPLFRTEKHRRCALKHINVTMNLNGPIVRRWQTESWMNIEISDYISVTMNGPIVHRLRDRENKI